MRVFVAGGTGVIGRQLIPQLTAAGHEAIVLVRGTPPRGAEMLTDAETVVADALDREGVVRGMAGTSPDAVVNMLTSIPHVINPRRLAHQFTTTNRLRTEGTRNLLEGAERAGARRFVAQGLAYAYEPSDEGPATESTPLWQEPPRQFRPVLDALRYMEKVTTGEGGLVLRLGHVYGPGSAYSTGGSFVGQVRDRKMPIVGAGDSVFSFVHAHDVAAAVVASLESNVTGVLNVVDDDPAPIREWLPILAGLIGAPPPRRLPAIIARIAAGGWGLAFMTRLRGASNAQARQTLGWSPVYSSWRSGFAGEFRVPVPDSSLASR